MDPFASLNAELDALGAALRARGWRLALAESCTGGLLAAACTARAGSSDWFDCGWVTYSNEAKVQALGVDAALVAAHGAVSEAVALAMAAGARRAAGAQLALAITGVAGPGGGSVEKPVGTVWLGWEAAGGTPRAERLQLSGDRAAVRWHSMRAALSQLLATARG